jgi:hypothetical protein
MKIPPIDIKLVVHYVSAEVYIGETVQIKIAQSDPGAIIEIAVGVGIELFTVLHIIAKADARVIPVE